MLVSVRGDMETIYFKKSNKCANSGKTKAGKSITS